MRHKRVHYRPFTLLEILITLVLMGVIASTFSISFYTMWRDQKEKSGALIWARKRQLGLDLMRMGIDVTLVFDEERSVAYLEFDMPVSASWAHILTKPHSVSSSLQDREFFSYGMQMTDTVEDFAFEPVEYYVSATLATLTQELPAS